jgi:hypothetical protein
MSGKSLSTSATLLFLCAAPLAWAGGGTTVQVSAGRGRSNPMPEIAAPNAVRAQSSGELTFGTAVVYQNLSLVPVMVSAKEKSTFQKYTLLEGGLEDKTLAVRELKGQASEAQVNAVEVKNSGKAPVYLLGGEMILGGKQDRIIQNDTVVPSDNHWTKVSVFCVEQGRWTGGNMKFAAGQALAHVGLREAAMSGDQSKVWAAVAKKNRQQGTQNSTDTYRRTIQNEKVRAKIAPYREEILKLLPKDAQLAGLIFAINGKIRVADLFGNPVLFADLKSKLLSAYILEALDQQVIKNAPTLNAAAAEHFVGKARQLKKVKQSSSGRSINYKLEDKDQIGSETVDQGTGKKVRETYIVK